MRRSSSPTALLAGRYEQPLSRYVFPPPTFTDEDATARHDELTDTHVAQAALGATELAYLRVLRALGVEPDMTAGHSYGEFVALAAAGGLEADQMLILSEARGRLMAQAAAGEAGAMAAVEASAGDARAAAGRGRRRRGEPQRPQPDGDIGPVAGGRAGGRVVRRAGSARPHAAGLVRVSLAPGRGRPQTVLGRAQTRDDLDAADPGLLEHDRQTARCRPGRRSRRCCADHLVKPVKFVDEIEAMHDAGARVFVEVGPRSVLTGLTGQILAEREHVAVAVDRSGRSSLLSLLHGLAALATEGVPVRVDRLMRGRPAKRVDLTRLAAAAAPACARAVARGWRPCAARERAGPTVADSNHPSRASSTAAESNHLSPGAASRDQHS